jgi:diacylglycerol kinase (ATP)
MPERSRRRSPLSKADGRTVDILDAGTVEQAEDACRKAVAGGADALVAVGGDGTVHVGLQAIAGTSGRIRGVIPAGTGTTSPPPWACQRRSRGGRVVSQALSDGRTRAIDLGPDQPVRRVRPVVLRRAGRRLRRSGQ